MFTVILDSYNIDHIDLLKQSCHIAHSSGHHAGIIYCGWFPQEMDNMQALAEPCEPQEKWWPFWPCWPQEPLTHMCYVVYKDLEIAHCVDQCCPYHWPPFSCARCSGPLGQCSRSSWLCLWCPAWAGVGCSSSRLSRCSSLLSYVL